MPAKNKKIAFRDVVKYIIFTTNIIAIALLFCSPLAWHVSPLKTNFFSYIGLAFGFIFYINLLYFFFWLLFSKWRLALVSLIAMVICFKPVTTFFPFHPFPKKAPATAIKILTYNVEGFRNENRKGQSEHPLLEYIAKTDADIVCLQEYMVSKTGQSIISQKEVNRILKAYPYRSVTGLESSGMYHIYGLACFSKFPIKKTQEIAFDSSYNGAAIYSILIGDSIYTVANVHLESNRIMAEDKKLYSDFLQNKESADLDAVATNIRARMGRGFRKRAEQVKEVREYIDRQKTAGTIICGDFNDTPISYAYSHMKGNLKDAYVSNGFGQGITYHEDLFLFRIDYIFHSQNIQSYQTTVGKIKYSDHYPVYTYLNIPR